MSNFIALIVSKNNAMIMTLFFIAVSALVPTVSMADTIRINGSGSALDFMGTLVKAYQKNNRNVRIVMEKPLGSSGAVKALLGGALDVAVSSKPLKPEEGAQGARLEEFGRTPLVIITEKSVPRRDITTKELEEMFAGTITKWQDGQLIRLVLRPDSDIDTHILRGLSPGMNISMSAAKSRAGMITATTDPEAYSAIARTPGGLGATGLVSIITEKLNLNVLSLNGVAPSLKNLASGAYPLHKKINFVTVPGTPPAALKFISFAYSSQGRAIAKKSGVLVTSVRKTGTW